ncbi:MAG: ComEC/Rec2 family competence protein, partial [Chitinophagaceae bacterium]|nr:ComEC/Rec2 family competence protein [Chitinophagaceae bacterium]
MSSYASSIWKQAPFIRLLPPLIAGIVVQYYFPLPIIASWRLTGISLCGLTLYSLFTPYTRFALQWLTGICIHLLLFSAGALLTYYKDSSALAREVSLFCKITYPTAGLPNHSSFSSLTNPVIDSTGRDHRPSTNRKTLTEPSTESPADPSRSSNLASVALTGAAIGPAPRKPQSEFIAILLENPSEKKSSWKALATIHAIHKPHLSTLSDTLSASHRENKQETTPPDLNAPQSHTPSSLPDKTFVAENNRPPHGPDCSMTDCGKIYIYFLKKEHLSDSLTAPTADIANHKSTASLPNPSTVNHKPGMPSADLSTTNREPTVFFKEIDDVSPANPSTASSVSQRPDSITGEMRVNLISQSPPAYPRYGNIISFNKPLQPIKNFMPPGPGSFDYRRYCAFAGIHFQVFLRPGEFTVLPETHSSPLQALLIYTREKIIRIIQKYIPGKKEQGLAEALLIGYKDDLDKSLLQSYSNTGVVHVIAISGLHLGLIYALLKAICLPIARLKKGRWIEPLVVLSGLWLFSLLAGGAPSVLRSAVMFSFIVLGKSISREASIYNNLAASAFALLCYHPYWLWDVGFQLSYAALTGIVMFMKPVYRLLVFKNKMADAAWKLNAVTIAAQWLTLPLILFYFRQFPNLFLLTNFIAVPLSSIILIGELLLC